MFIFSLFYLLLLCLIYYDDLSVLIAEIMLLERGRVIAKTATAAHFRVAIDGKNYDLWVPYDPNLRAPMRSLKVTADGDSLCFYPGCLPVMQVKEMNYAKIAIKSPENRKTFKDQDIISIRNSREDKK